MLRSEAEWRAAGPRKAGGGTTRLGVAEGESGTERFRLRAPQKWAAWCNSRWEGQPASQPGRLRFATVVPPAGNPCVVCADAHVPRGGALPPELPPSVAPLPPLESAAGPWVLGDSEDMREVYVRRSTARAREAHTGLAPATNLKCVMDSGCGEFRRRAVKEKKERKRARRLRQKGGKETQKGVNRRRIHLHRPRWRTTNEQPHRTDSGVPGTAGRAALGAAEGGTPGASDGGRRGRRRQDGARPFVPCGPTARRAGPTDTDVRPPGGHTRAVPCAPARD